MENTFEMGFQFAEVHGHESILGKFIVKECLEELGVLREYMTKYYHGDVNVSGSEENSLQGLRFL